MKTVHILTPNLVIREMEYGDIIEVNKIRDAIAVTKGNQQYYALKKPEDVEKLVVDARDQRAQTPRETISLAIAEKTAPHKMIGFFIGELTELKPENWGGRVGLAHLGYFMHPEHQGKGYVTEALRAMMGKVYFEGLNYPHLSATVHPDNDASSHVLHSLGLTIYGETVNDEGEQRFMLEVTRDKFYTHTNAAGVNKNKIGAQKATVVRGFLMPPRERE